jgi:hypothetical protein
MVGRGRFVAEDMKAGVPLLPNLQAMCGVAVSREDVGRLHYKGTVTTWSAVHPRVAPALAMAVAGAAVLTATVVERRIVPILYRSNLLTLQRRKSGLQMEQKGSASALWRVLFAQMTTSPISVLSSVV